MHQSPTTRIGARPASNIARGWIHTNAGAHQHLFTRICSWLPPYHVGVERLNFEQHEVPTLFSAALSRGGHGAKRRRLSPSSLTASSHQTSQAPTEPEGANNWMPASLDWMGMELSSKTPVNILNELGPKVFRCYPEFVTTTQEDAVNPYLTTVVMEGIVVARGGFTNKKARNLIGRRPRPHVVFPPRTPCRPPARDSRTWTSVRRCLVSWRRARRSVSSARCCSSHRTPWRAALSFRAKRQRAGCSGRVE